MKKWIVSVFTLLFAVCGGIFVQLDEGVSFAENGTNEYIEITTESQYIDTFAKSTTYNNPNIVITLGADLDFSVTSMEGVFQNAGVFMGEFDGNGYTIRNITLSSNLLYYGLFPQARNATIKNLRVSGNIAFDIPESVVGAIYAGIIVGFGENVTISNCEIYNIPHDVVVQADQDEPVAPEPGEIFVNVPSNMTFGGLAGRLVSTTIVGEQLHNSLIVNCVNYYDITANVVKDSRLTFGGIVGSMSSGSKLNNTLQFGDVSLRNLDTISQSKAKYVGGIVGEIDGGSTYITNVCNGGSTALLSPEENAFCGTIVGYNNIASSQSGYNVNFTYWTQAGTLGIGGGYSINSDKLARVQVINQNLLSNIEMFDSKEQTWDFATTWSMYSSEIHLQNFMAFTYQFSSKLDAAGIIVSKYFVLNGGVYGDSSITIKHGIDITIYIGLQSEYYGYYTLASVLLNGDSLSRDLYEAEPDYNADGTITGYNITMLVNDTTDGTYSFMLVANQFNCIVEVSQEAIEKSQGGVKTVDASTPTNSIPLVFTETNRERSVTAVGNGVYSFGYWELYYQDENGDFTEDVFLEEDLRTALVQDIYFGKKPFDQEFKLVAYFTDAAAISIDFDITGSEHVKSIKVSGAEYQGSPIQVPPKSTSTVIEITTAANCVMDVDSFAAFVRRVYGNNPTDTLLTDPVTNAENETTYTFRINMNYVQGLTENKLVLPVEFEIDPTLQDSRLWLYIVLPIAGAILLGVIILLIVRKFKNGSGGGSKHGGKAPKVAKTKEKEVSYRDYYL